MRLRELLAEVREKVRRLGMRLMRDRDRDRRPVTEDDPVLNAVVDE
jgi:hypothetical protein